MSAVSATAYFFLFVASTQGKSKLRQKRSFSKMTVVTNKIQILLEMATYKTTKNFKQHLIDWTNFGFFG